MLQEAELAKKRELRNQKRTNQIEHRKKIIKAEEIRRSKENKMIKFPNKVELGLELATTLATHFTSGHTNGENNLAEWDDNDEGYGGTTSYTKFLPNNKLIHVGDSDGFDSTQAFIDYFLKRLPKPKKPNRAKTISYAGVGGSKGIMDWFLIQNVLFKDNELGCYVKATYDWIWEHDKDISEITPEYGKDSLRNIIVTFEKITDLEYEEFHGLGPSYHGVCIYGTIMKGLNYKIKISGMVDFMRRRYTHSKFISKIEDIDGNVFVCNSLIYPNKDYKPLKDIEDMTKLYNMKELESLMIDTWKNKNANISKKEIKTKLSRLTPTDYKTFGDKEYLKHPIFKIKTDDKEYWFELYAYIVGRPSETSNQELFNSDHRGNLHPYALYDAKKIQIPIVELVSPNRIFFAEVSILSTMWESRIDYMKFICKFHPQSPNLPYSGDKSKNADKKFEIELRKLIQITPIDNGFIYESDKKLSKKEELNRVSHLIEVKEDENNPFNLILLDNLSNLTGESTEDLKDANFGGETSGVHIFDLDNPIISNDETISNLEYELGQMSDNHLGELYVRISMPSVRNTMRSIGWIHGGHSTLNYDKLNRLVNKTDNPEINEALKKRGLKRIFTIDEKCLYKQNGWKEAKIIIL